jgi:RNA-directed DNA polymerase
VTAKEYAVDLYANITDLAERVKAGRYRAKLVRRIDIPKENGKQRPPVLPALDDKLVQLACAKLLSAIPLSDRGTGLLRMQPRLAAGPQRHGGSDRACA